MNLRRSILALLMLPLTVAAQPSAEVFSVRAGSSPPDGSKQPKVGRMSDRKSYDSYRGLVMAGYQGWFGAPGDGAGRGWYHYVGRNGFRPGSTNVDLLPDTREYKKLYKTEFTYDNGDTLCLPSSYDAETTELHFAWMEQYGLDGVFMQRFIAELKRERSLHHLNHVLDNAMQAAGRHSRAISVMYDLSGMQPADTAILLRDIDLLAERYHLKERRANPSYLWHNGRPLVAVWGVGFNDHRAYGLDEAATIVRGLKARGFSILIGVPTHWRDLDGDTESDPRLLELIASCDVVMPWFVGRYNETTYPLYFHQLIHDDMAWCREHGIDYAPLCFPGFSWNNMHYPHLSTSIPRNRGRFFRKQLDFCTDVVGAEMLYIAMFDEIDEGTAIMKCASRMPTPADGSTFVPVKGPSDRYLKLAGRAARKIKKVKR